MFEDLIPSASAQTPPPAMFDDLIPTGGAIGGITGAITAAPEGPDGRSLPRSMTTADPGKEKIAAAEQNSAPAVPISESPTAGASRPPGLFDDLIPPAAVSGGTGGGTLGALAPEYEPIPDPSLGLKDAKTGIPLVRESKPGRFIAEVAGEDDGGLFWKDPETGEIQRPGGDELIRPEGGKFKVYERHEVVRPWTVADMALIRAIVSGFAAAHDAFAGNMAPNEVIPRALDFAALTSGAGRTPVPRRPRATPLRPESEPSAEPTGPPPDQASPPQNGAPSGAVSISGGPRVLRLPADRLVGRPKRRGSPPIGDDGYPVERHHQNQVPEGPTMEMTRTDHRLGENYRINHPNTGQRPSLIDRAQARRDGYRAWAQDWDEGKFDNLP